MFINLSTGSDLYVLDTKGRYKLTIAKVVKVAPSPAKQSTYNPMNIYPYINNNGFVDIVATLEGEQREFKNIPGNSTIANFGSDGFVLTDGKDSYINHLNTTRQYSESVISSVKRHTEIAEDCKALLLQADPNLAAEAQRDKAIDELKSQVNVLTEQLTRVVNVLNPKTDKTE